MNTKKITNLVFIVTILATPLCLHAVKPLEELKRKEQYFLSEREKYQKQVAEIEQKVAHSTNIMAACDEARKKCDEVYFKIEKLKELRELLKKAGEIVKENKKRRDDLAIKKHELKDELIDSTRVTSKKEEITHLKKSIADAEQQLKTILNSIQTLNGQKLDRAEIKNRLQEVEAEEKQLQQTSDRLTLLAQEKEAARKNLTANLLYFQPNNDPRLLNAKDVVSHYDDELAKNKAEIEEIEKQLNDTHNKNNPPKPEQTKSSAKKIRVPSPSLTALSTAQQNRPAFTPITLRNREAQPPKFNLLKTILIFDVLPASIIALITGVVIVVKKVKEKRKAKQIVIDQSSD